MGDHGINIYGMQLGRRISRGPALMVLNLDEHVPETLLEQISSLPGFFDVKLVTG
ncbi:hypothetical protein D3C87_2125550 [compost metagenome]